MAQHDTGDTKVAEKRQRLFVWLNCTVKVVFPFIAVLCQDLVQTVPDTLCLVDHVTLQHGQGFRPACLVVILRLCGPVCRELIPGNSWFAGVKIRNGCVKFPQPRQFCGISAHFLQCLGCCILGTSQGRDVERSDRRVRHALSQQFCLVPSLFCQRVFFIVRIAVADK